MGDIVHTVPMAVALRRARPEARIDWIVDRRHAAVLDLFPVADEVIAIQPGRETVAVVRRLRETAYDVVIDAQGLLKSAVMARLAGGRRTIGFSREALREPAAVHFYTETVAPRAGGSRRAAEPAAAARAGHRRRADRDTDARGAVRGRRRRAAGDRAALRRDQPRARGGRTSSGRPRSSAPWLQRFRSHAACRGWPCGARARNRWRGASRRPRRGRRCWRRRPALADLMAIVQRAAIVVAGDTGPVHLAAAAGTPVVGLYGPTNPARNGPWSPEDVCVSRFDGCRCHHKRRCTAAAWCLDTIAVDEVIGAVERRLRQ